MVDYGTATILVILGLMAIKDFKWHKRINQIKKTIRHYE